MCCLNWQNNQLELIECDRQQSLNDILTWLDTQVSPTEPAIVAVDAPTIIANPTGMREADKLTHKHFGRHHAGCYPANLSRPFAQKTVEFGLCLEARGFVHAPIIEAQKLGRYQIEVFPHPATINLFKLDRIIKYKKGKLAERQLELMKLCQYIVDILPSLEPLSKSVFWHRHLACELWHRHLACELWHRQDGCELFNSPRNPHQCCNPQSLRRQARCLAVRLYRRALVVLGNRAEFGIGDCTTWLHSHSPRKIRRVGVGELGKYSFILLTPDS